MKRCIPLLLFTMLILAAVPSLATESSVLIEGAAWQIPVTISMPEGEGPFPFVVMFHGTGSDKNEAGGGYALLAPKLAEAGIASARFDFAGSGESPVDYTNYTLTSGMDDGNAVIAHMQGLEGINPDRIGLLGWSQGGTVAMLTAARNPAICSLVTWAGAVDMSGFMAEKYEEANQNGYAVVEFDWREPLHLSHEWYKQVREIKIADELKAYDGAVLAIAGSQDDVVPPSEVNTIVSAVPTEAKQSLIIDEADHTFNIFSGNMTAFDYLMEETVSWFDNTL